MSIPNNVFTQFLQSWKPAADELSDTISSTNVSNWNVFKKSKETAPTVKEVFIDEMPKIKTFEHDPLCTVDELMFRAVMQQAYYSKRVRENIEKMRPTLMQLFSGANQKQCDTYATTGVKSWRYIDAGLQFASVFTSFTNVPNAELVSKGLSGAGSASGGVGGIWSGHDEGQRAAHGHSESYYRRLVDNTDRSASNIYSNMEVLARLVADIVNKTHQSKTEMVR